MLHLGSLFLRYFCQLLPLGSLRLHQFVCNLICTALVGTLRMAIECCHAQRVYTVLVGKLGAVVVRDGVEYQLPIAANLII